MNANTVDTRHPPDTPIFICVKRNGDEPIPRNMKTVAVTFHVPEDVQKRLAQLAAANERTLSGELRVAIRNHLEATK